MSKLTAVVIFSKDRAFQLHALLEGLHHRCVDLDQSHIFVQYFASNSDFDEGYRNLQESWREKLLITWIREKRFKVDLIGCLKYTLSKFDGVLFFVDDCLIVRDFSLGDILMFLELNNRCLGYSLRLGRNTSYCYSRDRKQSIPAFFGDDRFLYYNWSKASYDFSYPLEISSSYYRVKDIYWLLRFLPYKNPNTLEQLLSRCTVLFRYRKPYLACSSYSIAFCAPLNKVQSDFRNRSGDSSDASPESLNRALLNGEKLDISSITNYKPKACHEEIELKVLKTSREDLHNSIAVLMCALPNTPTLWLVDSLSSTLNGLSVDDSVYLRIDGGKLDGECHSRINQLKYVCNLFIIEDSRHIGLAGGLNYLIDIAVKKGRYKYFARMDADDISVPNRFKYQRDFLDKHGDVDIVGGFCEEMTEDMRFIKLKRMPLSHHKIINSLAWRNGINHPTVMMRSSIFKYGFRYNVDCSKTEDYHLWITLASNGFIFENMAESMIFFRRNLEVLSRRSGAKQFLADWEVRRRAAKELGVGSFLNNILAITAVSSRLLPVFMQKILYLLR